MATTLPEFTVVGLPIFGNPFDQDAPPEFIGGGLSLNELAAATEAQYPGATPEPEQSFAPPTPVLPPQLLPEVIVEAPSLLGTILTGITALLFPQPMGPREFDEAPGGGGAPPPPGAPVGEDPIMPPNWYDLINEPFPTEGPKIPLLPVPVTPVEMPPGEEFVEVRPPKVTSPSVPIEIPWLTPIVEPLPFAFEPYTPVEVPLVEPGIELQPTVAPSPGPGPAPAPSSPTRVDPVPVDPFIVPDEFRPAAPLPADPTAPDVFSSPLPDVVGDPIGDPFVTPRGPAPSSPDTRVPTVTGEPDSLFTPVDSQPLNPSLDDPFLVEFGPSPVPPEADTCSCAKKPKKKPKPKPRNVCYRGTYVQRTRGISYHRLEEVPCEAAPKQKRVSNHETDTFGRPVPKTRGKRRTKNWKQTVDEVFGRLLP